VAVAQPVVDQREQFACRVPESFLAQFEGFAGADMRDESSGRKSVRVWLLSAHLS